jgi:hypothetical protein
MEREADPGRGHGRRDGDRTTRADDVDVEQEPLPTEDVERLPGEGMHVDDV